MKTPAFLSICVLSFFFTKNSFGQSPVPKRASQNAVSYENNLYHLSKTERDPQLFVKSIFFRRDLPHWRRWLCRIDIGASWYNNGWYLENHIIFGRPVKKVDILGGLSFRNGNLPKEFLEDNANFLNPELLLVVRPRPFFKWLTVEARLNMALISYYDWNETKTKYIEVPGFGLSFGYVLTKRTH